MLKTGDSKSFTIVYTHGQLGIGKKDHPAFDSARCNTEEREQGRINKPQSNI